MKENETKTQQQSKGKKVAKTILNTIINVMIVIVLLTSLLIAVLALTSRANGVPTVFGYTIQPIQSDSMKGGSPDGYEGGDFEKGDLMIAKSTGFDDLAEYSAGDIVTFRTRDTDNQFMLISHRIVDAEKDNAGVMRYQTWGDNREMAQVPDQDDPEEFLTAQDIASVFYSKDYHGTVIKGWGKVIDYLQTQQGFFFVVLLPMIIFFMYEMFRVVLNAMNYKKSKAEEDKDAAVKEAVAAALAGQQASQPAAEAVSDAPAGMSAEELEQFRQFQEFQKMQKAQQEAAENTPDTSAEE